MGSAAAKRRAGDAMPTAVPRRPAPRAEAAAQGTPTAVPVAGSWSTVDLTFAKNRDLVDAGSPRAVAQTVGAFAPVALDRRPVPSRLFEERDGPPQVLEGLGSKRRMAEAPPAWPAQMDGLGPTTSPQGSEPCDDVDAHRLQLG
jgi:hypothetical protein